MSKLEAYLREKIRNAPHQGKPDEANLVVYDCDGRWLFEGYTSAHRPLKISTIGTKRIEDPLRYD